MSKHFVLTFKNELKIEHKLIPCIPQQATGINIWLKNVNIAILRSM